MIQYLYHNNILTMSEHRFYFKLAYTNQTIYYNIDLNSTMTSFILNTKHRIRENLNISENYDIEIIEAGQYNNVNGRDAELAPALTLTDTTLIEKYRNNYKDIAFYIRKIPFTNDDRSMIIY
jgi:hypothetical protein